MANDTDGLLTAQNARIQNLEAGLITQGQGLLALEQTQQQILTALQANTQALNNVATILQQSERGLNYIPDDLVFIPYIPAAYEAKRNSGNYLCFPSTGGWASFHKYHCHISLNRVDNNNLAAGLPAGYSFLPFSAINGVYFICNYNIKIKFSSYFSLNVRNKVVTLEDLINLDNTINSFHIFGTSEYDANNLDTYEVKSGYSISQQINSLCETTNSTTVSVRVGGFLSEGTFETNNIKNLKTKYMFQCWLLRQGANKAPTKNNAQSTILGNNGTWGGGRLYIEIERVGDKLYEPELATLEAGDYNLLTQSIVS